MKTFLTGKELCEHLKISPTTRWRYIKSGILPAPRKIHPDGRNLWDESEISEITDSLSVANAYQSGDYCDTEMEATGQ